MHTECNSSIFWELPCAAFNYHTSFALQYVSIIQCVPIFITAIKQLQQKWDLQFFFKSGSLILSGLKVTHTFGGNETMLKPRVSLRNSVRGVLPSWLRKDTMKPRAMSSMSRQSVMSCRWRSSSWIWCNTLVARYFCKWVPCVINLRIKLRYPRLLVNARIP